MPAVRRAVVTAITAFLVPGLVLAQGGPPAMPVGTSEPIAKRIIQWDEYSGRFESLATVEVRARVSGFVDKLHFKDGQWVKAGDPLFTIDKRPYEIAVEQATADVARNKAQVELAELQVSRGAALIGSRTITEQENDTRKSNLAVAKAQLKAEIIFLTHNAALHDVNLRWHPKAEALLWRPDIQETKRSEGGMENLRYRTGWKGRWVRQLTDLVAEKLPECRIRYAF